MGSGQAVGQQVTLTCITGSTGFIGGALARGVVEAGREVLPARSTAAPGGISEWTRRTQAELARALAGVDTLYHLAGLQEGARRRTSADFDTVNHDLTLRLYKAARAAGVRRFVWLSTIKVLGEVAELPLGPDAPYAPAGAYAASKARGEQALLAAAGGSTELAIVRPPLVYGPGVKGNFAALLRLCRSGLPLPVANATARRSMVGLANLVDFLVRLASADLGAAEILHVRDAQEWCVAALAGEMQRLAGHAVRQFPVSRRLVDALAGWMAMQGTVSRLFDPLRVAAQSSQRRVGWTPPHTSEQILEETVAWTASRR